MVVSFLCTGIMGIHAQNMIQNNSFEEVECPDNTIASFYETEFWKVTGADAYWMHYSCPPDPVATQSIFAIKTGIIPYEGSGYISLECAIFNNGFILTEGVSQQLERPIKKNSYYYLELATLKYGLLDHFEMVPEGCSDFPDRGLEFRLDNKHIEFDLDSKSQNFLPIIMGMETSSKVIFDDIHIEDKISSGTSWDVYWNCFQADDDYEYIAVGGPTKFFDELNSCMEEGLEGVQWLSGYAIDFIQLYELPETLDTTISLCQGAAVFVLGDLIEGPFLKRATLRWEDGVTGGDRTFTQAGSYVLNMELPCRSFPITVHLEEENCDVNVFMPNIFSVYSAPPHNIVKPYVQSDFPIEEFSWIIYDRWGNLLFETNELDQEWDGRFNGSFVDKGVYMWKIEYSINRGLVKEEVIGSLTLLK